MAGVIQRILQIVVYVGEMGFELLQTNDIRVVVSRPLLKAERMPFRFREVMRSTGDSGAMR